MGTEYVSGTSTAGFTLIELLVVITLMGILLTVGVVAQSNLRDYATDRERGDDVASIARRLEQAYSDQDLGAPSYPSTRELLTDVPGRTRTLSGITIDALSAPGMGSQPTVRAAVSTSQTVPYPDMSTNIYVYQPLTSDGSLCTASPSIALPATRCVRYFLYYLTRIDSKLTKVVSVHQQ